MGRAPRNRPKLLHLKLRALREYLNLNQVEMAENLQSAIASHSQTDIPINRSQISNFEHGTGEPDWFMIIGYARLGSVLIESLADDEVSVQAFRKRLGKELKQTKKVGQPRKKRVKP
jgi:transcriptional regulator with XRE-family HTH domain